MKPFFLFLFLTFTASVSLAQQIISFKPIGNFSWSKRKQSAPPQKLAVRAYEQKTIKESSNKISSKPFKKKLDPETRLLKFDPTKIKSNSVVWKGSPIILSEKIPAKDFLYKDNSSFNVTYTDRSHGFICDGVTAVTEDEQHNIWMITDLGLVKYDGFYYYVYNKKSGLPSVLFDDVLFVKNSGVWVASEEGIFIVKNDSCFIPKADKLDNKLIFAKRVSQDRNGNVWVCTKNMGAICFNNKGSYKIYDMSSGLPSEYITKAHVDKKGSIWFALWAGGVAEVSENTMKHYFGKGISLNYNSMHSIYEDSLGIWLGGFDSGIIRISEMDTVAFSLDGKYKERVYDILEAPGGMWLNIYGNGICYFREDEFFMVDATNGLVDRNNFRLFKDSFNNLWAGDIMRGLSRINETPLFKKSESKSFWSAVNIHEDKNGNRWYFQNGGKITKETSSTIETYINKGTDSIYPLFYAMDGVWSDDGALWVATYASGICRVDDKKFTFYRYSNSTEDEVIYDAERDSKNNIWFSTMLYGLVCYDAADKNFYHYSTSEGILTNRPNKMQADAKGNIWCAFGNGLQKFSNNSIYDFCVNNKQFDFNPSSFFITKEGTQLIGTTGKGLFMMSDNQVYALNTSTGFYTNDIQAIAQDKSGTIWISTIKNIIRFKINNDKTISNYRVFDYNYGLSISKTLGSVFIDEKGNPAWSIVGGILSYNPLFENKTTKSPIINVNGIAVNKTEINASKTFVVLPDDEINFFYNLKCWGHEQELVQKYIIVSGNGGDTVRYYVGEKGLVKIKGMNPGNYSFILQIEYAQQKYFSKSVHFTVKPYWYNRWWFRILLVIFLISLVVIYFLNKSRVTQKRTVELEEKIAEHTAELLKDKLELENKNIIISSQNANKDVLIQEIHHRVKNNLQLISAIIDMQLTHEKAVGEASSLIETSRRISAMAIVHEMLYAQTYLDKISAKKYLGELISSIIQLVNFENLPVKFKLEIEDVYFNPTECIAIGMITSELVANSIKHAFKGVNEPTILMSLSLVNKEITFAFSDNGMGYTTKTIVKKMGSRLIDIFSRQLKGSYKITEEPGIKIVLTFNHNL